MSQRNHTIRRSYPAFLDRKESDKKSTSRVRRISSLEALEARMVMAGDVGPAYQNNALAADVDMDGRLSMLDALHVIHELRAYGTRDLTQAGPNGSGAEGEEAANPLMVDVNGDNVISTLDALLVIKALRAEGQVDIAEVKVTLLNPSDTPLGNTALNVGDSFQVYVTVDDLRTAVSNDEFGIAAAYLDINFAASLLEASALINTGTDGSFAPLASEPAYSQIGSDHSGTVDNSIGKIDEVGNREFFSPLGANPVTLVHINFQVQVAPELISNAAVNDNLGVSEDALSVTLNVLNNDDKVGTTLIDAAAATGLGHELITFTPPATVPTEDVIYTDATLRINTAVTITDTSTPNQGGSVSIALGGQSLIYTPLGNFSGEETFTYTITGANGGTSTATVTMTVGAANDNPDAVNDPVSVQQNSSNNTLTVLSNDTALPDTGETLTIIAITQPGSGASLSINGGVGGTTLNYTPPSGFTGQQQFTYTISDGNGGTDTATVTVTVSAGNAAPIATLDPVSINEGGSTNVLLSSLLTNDSPGTGESGQTITLTQINGLAVANQVYTGSAGGTLTVTGAGTSGASGAYTPPSADFFGEDNFTYTIQDNGTTGGNPDPKTATGTLRITVNAVNDAPSFTKGADQTVDDDAGAQTVVGWATSISKGPSNESAQTLTFNITGNTNPSLFSTAPAISSNGTLTFTPSGTTGSATISVQLQDSGGNLNGGVNVSGIQTFVITVVPPTVPRAKPDNGIADEDGSVTVTVLTNDDRSVGSTLTITDTTDPTNGSIVVNPDKTITYTPDPDFFGTDSFTYTIDDDDAATNDGPSTTTVSITVNSKNDAPEFTGGPNITRDEDAGAQTIANWATSISTGAANESQTLTFVVTGNTNPSLFSSGPAISASGTLTFTSAAQANGSSTITVELRDNGPSGSGEFNTSTSYQFTISINALNDPPSFTKGPNQTVNEGVGAQTVTGWATNINPGAANESGQVLTFNITNNTNPTLFSAAPAISSNGTLTYTPAADASGTATISVQLVDNGGGDNASAVQTFTIAVNAVNDAPSFTVGGNQVVTEDSGPHTVNGFATGISAGPANESGQTLTFDITGNTNPSLFASGPSISATGVLTYTLAQHANGGAQITVVLRDSGGIANGGVDSSAPQSFNIFVTEVNDAPLANNDTFTAFTNGGVQTFNPLANDNAGAANESTQSLTITNVTAISPTSAGTIDVAADGKSFTYTPANAFEGTATFNYTITDNGTTAGAADPKTATGQITLNVLAFIPSVISGIVFADANNDGVLNTSTATPERLLGDVEVSITGTDLFSGLPVNIPSQVTSGDGKFSFGNLSPGEYDITVSPPEHSLVSSASQLVFHVSIGQLGGVFQLDIPLGVRGLDAEFISPIETNGSTSRSGAVALVKLNPAGPSTQYWFAFLDGWEAFKSITASVPFDMRTVTITAVDQSNVTHTLTLNTTREPRVLITRKVGNDITLRLYGSSNLFFPGVSATTLEGEGEFFDSTPAVAARSLLLAPTPVSATMPAASTTSSAPSSSSATSSLQSLTAAVLGATSSTPLVSSSSSSRAEGESLASSPVASTPKPALAPVTSKSVAPTNHTSAALSALQSSHQIDLSWLDSDGNLSGGIKRLKKAYAGEVDQVFAASSNWLRR